MKNFIQAFIVFLLWSAFGIWIYACQIKNLCVEVPPKETSPEPVATDTVATREEYGSEFALEQFDDFYIAANTDSVSVTGTSENIEQLLFNFLNEHQDKELLITGLHNTEEESAMGDARASMLKEKFTAYGINPDRIVTQSSRKRFDFDEEGRYRGGIELQYRDISESRKALIEKGLSNKILYSNFASEKFKPDNTLQAYAEELKNYLDKYPEKEVVITGHTDNVGPVEANEWIGMQRAKNVMKYLISVGIPEEKLEALSKGPHAPIATNATPEGRRQNRRIEINVN
ncbi:OmpA family protein [Sinomicrobium weinanense]|uniref:OmpA family protein n=1 Tax=Sinomicrobium weinanense TaxID=2842200 RepID=A0A926JUB3_9FLAO|nr:OmpA family protein [Sinomicrobium weinanense]MBC9797657.1 OmpA family protein [Sinomicrobium weinanense]MBU3122661.1 OmpA family protein [Sinomicrobium weinanense]